MPEPTAPCLLIVHRDGTERAWELDGDEHCIGRGHDCEILLDDRGASRRHALVRLGPRPTIEDLGSRNGTTVDGQALGAGPGRLVHGARIRISSSEIWFVDPSDDRPVATHADPETDLDTALAEGALGRILIAREASGLESDVARSGVLRIVAGDAHGARLLVRESDGTRIIDLGGEEAPIGADAVVGISPHGRVLRDLGSAAGTYVNGVQIEEHSLREGDRIQVGPTRMVYEDGRSANRAPSEAERRRPVVLIPDLCGSRLLREGQDIGEDWLRKGGESSRDPSGSEVQPGGLIDRAAIVPGLIRLESYEPFRRFLVGDLGYALGVDLLEFPYDWRRGIRRTARELADAVREWRSGRDESTRRVVLLSFGMGGLATRFYLDYLDGADNAERAVLVGTPQLGATQVLTHLLDPVFPSAFEPTLERSRRFVRAMASVYQLLPSSPEAEFEDGSLFEPLADDAWVAPEHRHLLEAATVFRGALDAAAEPRIAVPVTSIHGVGRPTPASMKLRREADGSVSIVGARLRDDGDGFVLESAVSLPGEEAHPVFQEHGAMHLDRRVWRRLRYELLER